MFLLATQAEPQMLEFAHPNLGRFVQPRHYARVRDTAERGVPWAADNDAFNGGVDAAKFLTMLEAIDGVPGCRFVAVPDVVADAMATLHEFETWLPRLHDYDLPLAFVLQDGVAAPDVPWDLIEALFIGGSDAFKLGEEARQIVAEAQARGKWVHMGRVNTKRRVAYAREIGCDSIDGTKWVRWRDTYLREGLGLVSAPPQSGLLAR
jgi:hypothetical protein